MFLSVEVIHARWAMHVPFTEQCFGTYQRYFIGNKRDDNKIPVSAKPNEMTQRFKLINPGHQGKGSNNDGVESPTGGAGPSHVMRTISVLTHGLPW